jgi:hypothetical protein
MASETSKSSEFDRELRSRPNTLFLEAETSKNSEFPSEILQLTPDQMANLTAYTPDNWKQIFAFDFPPVTEDEFRIFKKLHFAVIYFTMNLALDTCTESFIGKKLNFDSAECDLKSMSVDKFKQVSYANTNVWNQLFKMKLPTTVLEESDLTKIREYCVVVLELMKNAIEHVCPAVKNNVSIKK